MRLDRGVFVGCRCDPKEDRWEGGYIRHGIRNCVYVIEQQWGGDRYHVSTRRTTLRDAMRELERFELDREGYNPFGRPAGETSAKLELTDTLILEYNSYQLEERGTTRKHANEMSNRLTEWMEDLHATDLRKVTLRQLNDSLDGRGTCRQHRIIAIKGFYGWLRRKGKLTHRDDPTEDIKVPAAIPAKLKKRKALDRERVLAALAKLDGLCRDCLLLLIATGWHVTELERFIRNEDSSVVRPRLRAVREAGDEVLAVLATRHKTGGFTRTPIRHQEHLDAAERLRAAREVPRRLNDAMKAACKAAEVEEFTLGVLRHSVATWAVEDGAAVVQVAEFLNHRDVRTTRRFYADVSVPTVHVPVLRIPKGDG